MAFAPLHPLLMRLAQAVTFALVVELALATAAPAVRAAVLVAPGSMQPSPDVEAAPPSGLDAALEQQVRALALGSSTSAPEGVSRVEVVVGQLDARLRLAPCAKVEPYLPNGTRLWGKSRIGLRCVQGTTLWNVYLPITIKAFGRALVSTTGAPAGSLLKAGDLAQAEVDMAEDTTPMLREPEQAIGRTLAQALKPGQGIHQSHLKVRLWFSAGDTVKVVGLGDGFSLEGEGQALSNGIEGQPARVRTESGHVLSGLPVGDRRLEVAL